MKATSAYAGRSNRTSLNCEQLESRSNPSKVTAVLTSANNLIVTGDNSTNLIIVMENLAGDYYVIGENGTSVNGQGAVSFGVIHPQNVVIVDGNGNDQIAVYGVHAANNFALLTGNGNDFVNLSGVVASYVLLNEQGGNNTLETTSVVARIGAHLIAGKGFNVWNDNGLTAGQYIHYSGWDQIST